MADSVFKQWDDKIDSLVNDDFKKGVMTAIRQLKEEVYNMKVDNLNQSMGRVIRDDKRIGNLVKCYLAVQNIRDNKCAGIVFRSSKANTSQDQNQGNEH